MWRHCNKQTKKFQFLQTIVEKLFCHLIVYLLLNSFGVVLMVMGELFINRKGCKTLKYTFFQIYVLLHFLSNDLDWRLYQADSGPQALCLTTLLETLCLFVFSCNKPQVSTKSDPLFQIMFSGLIVRQAYLLN